MTINVLKDLHKSLETCPSSGILLDDPKGLVVPLMPHQKHAIAWLMWREQQEPSGGILGVCAKKLRHLLYIVYIRFFF